MALVRSDAALALVKTNYENPNVNDTNMLLISAFLRPGQKRIIDGLAKSTGRGKAEILREIIDEWSLFVMANERVQ